MFGFSRRHGPHQLAQKSIKTNFPLSEDNLIKTPFGFLKTSSGAVFPKFRPTTSNFKDSSFLLLLTLVK